MSRILVAMAALVVVAGAAPAEASRFENLWRGGRTALFEDHHAHPGSWDALPAVQSSSSVLQQLFPSDSHEQHPLHPRNWLQDWLQDWRSERGSQWAHALEHHHRLALATLERDGCEKEEKDPAAHMPEPGSALLFLVGSGVTAAGLRKRARRG
jgi:hypothetical protein